MSTTSCLGDAPALVAVDRAPERRAIEPTRGRAATSRRVEIAEFGRLAEPGEVVLSSHSTSEGIVTYLRRRDGTTIVRRHPVR